MNKIFTIDLKSHKVNAYVSRYVARQTGNGMAIFDNVDELLANPNIDTGKLLDVFNKVSTKQVKRFADKKTGAKRLFNLISEMPITETNWDSGEYNQKVLKQMDKSQEESDKMFKKFVMKWSFTKIKFLQLDQKFLNLVVSSLVNGLKF